MHKPSIPHFRLKPFIQGSGRQKARQPSGHHEKGAILIITLMAIILLSASIIMIFNLGNQINRKMIVQNAADGAVVGGGGSIARSFNNIAMNNVGMAHYISAINIIDSMPLAIDYSIKDDGELILGDETAIYLAVVHELNRTNAWPIWTRELERTRDKIGEPETTVDGTDEKMLFELDEWFRNNPDAVPNATYYNAPSGDFGTMWQAMFALDTYNKAIHEQLGEVAQINAAHGGRHHQSETEVYESAFMLPFKPEIPMERGEFNDFQSPVLHGLLPAGTDHTINRRGPWDTVFAWRDHNRRWRGGQRNFGLPPSYSPPTLDPNATYRVIGPHDWMKRWFENTVYGRLPYHLRRITDIKMAYLWPEKRDDSTRDTLEYLIEPDWEVDIETDNERSAHASLSGFESGDQDETRMMLDDDMMEVPLSEGDPEMDVNTTVWEFAEGQRNAIKETLSLTLTLAHKYPNEDFDDNSEYPSAASPTWVISPLHERRTHEHYHRGWRDFSRGPTLGGEEREWEAIDGGRYSWWTRVKRYTNPLVDQGTFPEIGITEPIYKGTIIDENGNEIIEYEPQPFWVTQFRLLIGVNVGMERVIEDPYTGFDPASSEAPAPLDFVHGEMTPDEYLNHEKLTFLGVAQGLDHPKLFTKRFQGNKPYAGKVVGLAQGKVFNDHSWDLWTQMWQVQLSPVQDLTEWSNMASSVEEIDSASVASSEEVSETGTYLERLSTLADEIGRH